MCARMHAHTQACTHPGTAHRVWSDSIQVVLCGNRIRIAVEGSKQETLYLIQIRKGIPVVEFCLYDEPRAYPIPEETRVTHLPDIWHRSTPVTRDKDHLKKKVLVLSVRRRLPNIKRAPSSISCCAMCGTLNLSQSHRHSHTGDWSARGGRGDLVGGV